MDAYFGLDGAEGVEDLLETGVCTTDLKSRNSLMNLMMCALRRLQVRTVLATLLLTSRKTPTTASPSGLLAASPKLAYLVFQ